MNARPLCFVAALVALTACTPVQPWERGNLAKRQMANDPHPAWRATRDHVHRSREAASGGDPTTRGAGCGCY